MSAIVPEITSVIYNILYDNCINVLYSSTIKALVFFFKINVYLYCPWKTSYQDGCSCNLINQFKPVIFTCLSQGRTLISNVICSVFFMFIHLRWEVAVRFVNIGRSVDRCCSDYLFLIFQILVLWLFCKDKLYSDLIFFFHAIFISNRHGTNCRCMCLNNEK